MNKLQKAFFAFAILYLIWHFGRWYEFKQLGQGVETYYFVDAQVQDSTINATSDLIIIGEIEIGTCYKKGVRESENIPSKN